MSVKHNNNFRNIIIPERLPELKIPKKLFISTVVNKIPIGLPPIRQENNYKIVQFPNKFEIRNKEIIKRIENFNKDVKNSFHDKDLQKTIKYDNAKILLKKQNKKIEEIRKDIYGENPEIKAVYNGIISNTKFDKLNDDYHASNIENGNKIFSSITKDLEDELKNEEELNGIIKEINNFDYEKYVKDEELREALYLLKSKYDKEFNKNEENIPEQVELLKEINIDERDTINYLENSNRQRESVKVDEALLEKEIDKTKTIIAENLLNTKNFKDVHSVKSIKKLLERQGFNTDKSNLTSLNIAVTKLKDGIQNFTYEPTILPYLRSVPIV